jgi:hypothetical protein
MTTPFPPTTDEARVASGPAVAKPTGQNRYWPLSLRRVAELRKAVVTLQSYVARKGLGATLMAVVRTLAHPVVRYRHHFIWEALLNTPRSPSPWAEEERFSIIGPETLDREMSPRLQRFLDADGSADDLDGVRKGDRLLLVEIDSSCVYSGYIYFDTTRETRREKTIYCEPGDAPVIGTCVSSPVKIWSRPMTPLPADSELARKLRRLLPADTAMESAAAGFKSLGQFLHTAQLAHNLEIPFDQLKARIMSGDSLWTGVAALRPGVDAMGEVRRVWDEASLHRRVLNDVFRYLQQLGYQRAINEVLADNLSSLNANKAVGMKICRELRTWMILGRLAAQRISEAGRSRWRVFRI